MYFWPTSLPVGPLLQGYEESIPNYTLRSKMDSGPAKVRRQCAAKPWPMKVSYMMTTAQLETFETWVTDVLVGGTLRFEWQHPRRRITVESRFLGTENLVTIHPSPPGRWIASFMLEVLP